jgi:hypothetical protein
LIFLLEIHHRARRSEVEYCPTKEMWLDVLAKPKQGHDFYFMWSKLMGCPIYLTDDEKDDNTSKMSELSR